MQYNNAACKGNRKLSVYQLPHERAEYPLDTVLRNWHAWKRRRPRPVTWAACALREQKCRRASCGADV